MQFVILARRITLKLDVIGLGWISIGVVSKGSGFLPLRLELVFYKFSYGVV